MIHLDYNLEPSEIRKIEGVDLITATANDLDYYLFCGDIIFRIDNTNLDARWGWVPIINFATQLYLIASEIKEGEARKLEYTESAAVIEFSRQGGIIEIKAEQAHAKVEASLYELRESATIFICRLFSNLTSRWPKLAQNQFFKERVDIVGCDES